MDNTVYLIVSVGAGIVIGLVLSLIYRGSLKKQKDSIELEKKRIAEEALKEAESLKKEASIEAKDIVYQAKTEAEK